MIYAKFWYGKHEGGTKFYHIVSFSVQTGSGKSSFALRHYGANAVFTKPGSLVSGSIEVDDVFDDALNAGTAKMAEKLGRGYDTTTVQDCAFKDLKELDDFIRQNFGPKAKRFANDAIRHLGWRNDQEWPFNLKSKGLSPESPESPVVTGPDLETQSNPLYGSW